MTEKTSSKETNEGRSNVSANLQSFRRQVKMKAEPLRGTLTNPIIIGDWLFIDIILPIILEFKKVEYIFFKKKNHPIN